LVLDHIDASLCPQQLAVHVDYDGGALVRGFSF
jgi:hypothetical protein